jgi:hypothetical protein
MRRYLHDIVFTRTVLAFASVLVAAVAMNITDLKAAGYPDRNPDGSINTGNASVFTVLTNGDFNASDSSFVKGNVGVGGNGNFNESGSAQVNGDLYMNNAGHINISGSAKVTGQKKLNQSTFLNNALSDSLGLSNAAKAEAVTPAYSSLTNLLVRLPRQANSLVVRILSGTLLTVLVDLRCCCLFQSRLGCRQMCDRPAQGIDGICHRAAVGRGIELGLNEISKDNYHEARKTNRKQPNYDS